MQLTSMLLYDQNVDAAMLLNAAAHGVILLNDTSQHKFDR
jgi:hypothetical protein